MDCKRCASPFARVRLPSHQHGIADDVARFGQPETPRDYRIEGLRQHFPQLRARLPAERQHIVMEPADLEASVAAWYERWPPSLQGRFRL